MLILKYKINGFWYFKEAYEIRYSTGILRDMPNEKEPVLLDGNNFVVHNTMRTDMPLYGERPAGHLSPMVYNGEERVKIVRFETAEGFPLTYVFPDQCMIYILQDGKTIERI